MGRIEPVVEAAIGLCWTTAQGNASVLRLLRTHSALELWSAPPSALCSWGANGRAAAAFAARRLGFRADVAVETMKAAHVWFVPTGSELYPEQLMELPEPPAGLFVAGTEEHLRELLLRPVLTIVGTRKASPYGLAAAETFSAAFGRCGVAVISGLALGIDGRAHYACLRAGGFTGGVLGCGVDVPYPRYHRDLHRTIRRDGVLLSELLPGIPPAPWQFPKRNRIMAALGDACLVVEAGVRSGAVGTAGLALELGRPVFAVPGPINTPSHRGCNELLYDGATPAFDPDRAVEDFLRETRITRRERGSAVTGPVARPAGEDLGPAERMVAMALGDGPCTVDEAAAAAGIGVREASVALCRLELNGDVQRAGPGRFVLAS